MFKGHLMIIKSKIIYILFSCVFFLISCSDNKTGESTVQSEQAEKSNQKISVEPQPEPKSKALTEKQEIEIEIQRIENLLKTKPTVRGWVLVGDANMQLKRYTQAASAYKDAYVLSDYSTETREKLKSAMYYLGLSNENNSE
jgi:cytochrome c-type biogenesis protein CcmH/NrfG